VDSVAHMHVRNGETCSAVVS